ncbi:ComEC/Rec2 family competence protein [Rhizobium mongolense]|uniref:Beta-lactamase superfamily II metal-dependent hydrolase n=1 Tax=Rhizobium mongolense TaxID=57676 RepID=A0A7W6WIM4_9HYPH|nr:MBL fold metallo-hydrolase [Rhizobium mongolense]MBB4278933.1 beta-lactamase superfamily II metal-dependent hydrolase [Rhizobium mongolense]
MNFRSASIALLVSISLAPVARGQQDAVPRYQDADGEEIFGPDYQPEPAPEKGLPLYIGRPNAGISAPDSLLLLPQDSFRQMTETWSLPTEDLRRQLPSDVPLLRDVRRGFQVWQMPRLTPNRQSPAPAIDPTAEMKVHYVYVGQGAGAIVELPCGVAVVDLGGEFGGGSGSVDGGALFGAYLKAFMEQRRAYSNKIDVVYLSHPHADHINGTKQLRESGITVDKVVDNGQTSNAGSAGKQTEFRNWATQGDLKHRYSAVELARQVTATGATNAAIDPFSCATVTAFWGGANEKLAIPSYSNPNNHSVVLRFDFGQASFLFMGDLEIDAAKDMLDQFDENTEVFDADVLQLAHHGATNGIADGLLKVVSPRIAIISMGDKTSTGDKSAWGHGHPRIQSLSILQDDPVTVGDMRPSAQTFWGYQNQEESPKDFAVSRAIYGTGWEGTIIVTANQSGQYTVSGAPGH